MEWDYLPIYLLFHQSIHSIVHVSKDSNQPVFSFKAIIHLLSHYWRVTMFPSRTYHKEIFTLSIQQSNWVGAWHQYDIKTTLWAYVITDSVTYLKILNNYWRALQQRWWLILWIFFIARNVQLHLFVLLFMYPPCSAEKIPSSMLQQYVEACAKEVNSLLEGRQLLT